VKCISAAQWARSLPRQFAFAIGVPLSKMTVSLLSHLCMVCGGITGYASTTQANAQGDLMKARLSRNSSRSRGFGCTVDYRHGHWHIEEVAP
jgi:hypothetical protein